MLLPTVLVCLVSFSTDAIAWLQKLLVNVLKAFLSYQDEDVSFGRDVDFETPEDQSIQQLKEWAFCWFVLIVPLKWIEYGFGYMIIRSPYTP